MKKYLNIIIFIIICVGALLISRHFFPKVIIESTHTSDTIWKDSVRVEYYPKSYPVYIDTGSVKVIELPIDSAAITKAYIKLHKEFYSTYFYTDTLKDDTTAFIQIDAQISQNKPVKYTLGYFDRTPSIINNTTNIHSQNEFYIGARSDYGGFNVNLLYKSKKGYILTGGYNPITSKVEVGGYVKLDKIKFW